MPLSSARLSRDNDLQNAAENRAPLKRGARGDAVKILQRSLIDLGSLHSPPAPQTLIIDAETLLTARDWAERLLSVSAQTKYVAVPGMVEMLMRAPFRSTVPQAAVAAICGWLGQLLIDPTASEGSSDARRAAPADPPSAVLTLQDGEAGQRSSITERPTFIASTAMQMQARRNEPRRAGPCSSHGSSSGLAKLPMPVHRRLLGCCLGTLR